MFHFKEKMASAQPEEIHKSYFFYWIYLPRKNVVSICSGKNISNKFDVEGLSNHFQDHNDKKYLIRVGLS